MRRYANISLKENLRRNLLTNQDVAFVTRLVYGTLENSLQLMRFWKNWQT